MGKSKVLIVGGTGYLGKRLVKASLEEGHETYVVHRPETNVDIERVQMLLSFKEKGAMLVSASFNDHQSLVNAVKLVDVVICAISGVHVRSHHILLQLKLVDAIKQAGNVKVPNCCAGYFLGGLGQPGRYLPSTDSVLLFGDGNKKAIYIDEDDIAKYTIKTIDDPRTMNKTVHLRPPKNILSQREVVQVWENLIGKELHKSSISKQEFLANLKDLDYAWQVGMGHYYNAFFEGCLTNFEIGDEGVEATQLYPEIKYVSVDDYMRRYL
ncbi:hypothetical protein CsatB_002434 [Cannabis sativa]